MRHLRRIFASVILLVSLDANAAFILNNNNSNVVNAFNIAETFQSFYGYGESVRASSNTGFEQVNTAVFLLAQYQGQYSLIGTFGSFIANGDPEGGKLTLDVTNNGFGNFLFVDDPSEVVNQTGSSSSIDFNYIENRTDGFIFDLGDGTNVDLTLLMTNITGLDSFQFLNSGGNSYSLTNQFNLSLADNASNSAAIPEPNGLYLLVLSMLIVLSIRKNRKN